VRLEQEVIALLEFDAKPANGADFINSESFARISSGDGKGGFCSMPKERVSA
jgi:hypothetical protein